MQVSRRCSCQFLPSQQHEKFTHQSKQKSTSEKVLQVITNKIKSKPQLNATPECLAFFHRHRSDTLARIYMLSTRLVWRPN